MSLTPTPTRKRKTAEERLRLRTLTEAELHALRAVIHSDCLAIDAELLRRLDGGAA